MSKSYVLEIYKKSEFYGNSTTKEEFDNFSDAIKAFESTSKIGISTIILKEQMILKEFKSKGN